ncbi:hypothetical protein PHISP_05762 [Aspergillus sp. HF37]|nr:hypothetical protein PHISP_05762 [Aspergillus sp. HF37]
MTGLIVFTHEIDSHHNFNVSDPCPFIALPNGDDLETGTMPRPDMPGAPMTGYEEVWRYLPPHEGPEGPGNGFSWILESDDGDLGEGQFHIQKVFLARICGTYLALHQGQTRVRTQTAQGWAVKVSGGDVSARREEWIGHRWEEKCTLGSNSGDLLSMAKGFDKKSQSSWYPGAMVNVGGHRYIVQAFEELA